MFFIKTLRNFFNNTDNNTKITLQQIYFLHKVLYKYNKEITFIQLYVYIHLYKKNFDKNQPLLYLFLGYIFFLKSQNIKYLYLIVSSIYINNNITTTKKYENNISDF